MKDGRLFVDQPVGAFRVNRVKISQRIGCPKSILFQQFTQVRVCLLPDHVN